MTKRQQIQQDFLKAFKEKNEVIKSTLSILKSKIVEAEKANSNKEASDEVIIKIINSSIKQRQQSIEAFLSGGRAELAEKEEKELEVLKSYLPTQMTDLEIETTVKEMLTHFQNDDLNQKSIVGKTIGMFNKQHNGKADIRTVKTIIEKLLEHQ